MVTSTAAISELYGSLGHAREERAEVARVLVVESHEKCVPAGGARSVFSPLDFPLFSSGQLLYTALYLRDGGEKRVSINGQTQTGGSGLETSGGGSK